MNRWTWIRALLISLMTLLSVGCASTGPDVVHAQDAQRLSDVREGVVRSVRPVTVARQPSGAGAFVGAVIGASAVHGPSRNPWRVSRNQALGVVAGATAGHLIEGALSQESAVEVQVALSGGRLVAVVQGQGEQRFAPGDPVAVIGSHGRYRIVQR